jgi:hypothetical protein
MKERQKLGDLRRKVKQMVKMSTRNNFCVGFEVRGDTLKYKDKTVPLHAM